MTPNELFLANLAVLKQKRPALHDQVQGIVAGLPVNAYQSVRRYTAADMKAVAEELERLQAFWNPMGSLMFGSLGHPQLLPEVARITEGFPAFMNGAEFPIYVVETDPLPFCLHLVSVNLAPVLSLDRVQFFIGPKAWDDVLEFFTANPSRLIPTTREGRLLAALMKSSEVEKAQSVFSSVQTRRMAEHRKAIEDTRARFPSAPDQSRKEKLRQLFDLWFDEVKKLYNAGGIVDTVAESERKLATLEERTGTRVVSLSPSPLPQKVRVLLVTSLFTTVLQHVVRDVESAFRRLGHETLLLVEKSVCDRWNETTYYRALADFQPHILFQMDHLRRELPHTPETIVNLTYIQDMLPNLLSEQAAYSLGPNDFVLVDKDFRWWQEFFLRYKYPPENFVQFPSCTNEETFKPTELTKEVRKRLGADVAVTTNIDLKPRQAWERIVETLLAGSRHRHLRDEASYQMFQSVANAFYRLTPLEWLAPLGLDMKIWGKYPQAEHPTLGRFFVGPARFDDLPKIYQASKITILGNHAGWRHYKTASVLASGGFPLVRFHPDSCEDIIDREKMMFRGPDDLRDKVRYWLSHDNERMEEVEKWRKKVLAERTYTVQIAKVLEYLRSL